MKPPAKSGNICWIVGHFFVIFHLIVWLWSAAGVSVERNRSRCWQRQTSSPAAGPYVVYRATPQNPGLAPYTRVGWSPKPKGEEGKNVDVTKWSQSRGRCVQVQQIQLISGNRHKTHHLKPWEEQHCRHEKVFRIKIHIETKTQTDTQDVTKAHVLHTDTSLPIKLQRGKGWNERLERK